MSTLRLEGPAYFSQGDESAFFAWIESVPAVTRVYGIGTDLIVELKSSDIDDESLRELISLFQRYQIDMTMLRDFENTSNKKWFSGNKSSFWHDAVFGSRDVHRAA